MGGADASPIVASSSPFPAVVSAGFSAFPTLAELRLPLRASRWLRLAVGLTHVLPLTCLAATEVSLVARLLVCAMVLLSGALTCRQWRDWHEAWLVFSPEGVQLELPDVPARSVEWVTHVALGPLRVLSLRMSDGRSRRVAVMRDGLTVEVWRRMNVLLRWHAASARLQA